MNGIRLVQRPAYSPKPNFSFVAVSEAFPAYRGQVVDSVGEREVSLGLLEQFGPFGELGLV